MNAARVRTVLAAIAFAATIAPLVLVSGCAPAVHTDQEFQPIDDLLSLVKERLELAEQISRENWISGASRNEPLAVSEELLDAAVNRSFEYTLPPEVVREFVSAQATAASYVQTVLHAQWQAQPDSQPTAKPATIGSGSLRPRIEPSTEPLLAALAKAYPLLRNPGGKDLLIRRAEVVLAGIPGGVQTIAAALRPLLSVAH